MSTPPSPRRWLTVTCCAPRCLRPSPTPGQAWPSRKVRLPAARRGVHTGRAGPWWCWQRHGVQPLWCRATPAPLFTSTDGRTPLHPSGLCYGKPEAAGLALLLPLLCLSHLAGELCAVTPGVQRSQCEIVCMSARRRVSDACTHTQAMSPGRRCSRCCWPRRARPLACLRGASTASRSRTTSVTSLCLSESF